MHLRLANGATGVIHATRFASGHLNDLTLRVFGTRGTLEGDGYSIHVYDFLTGRTTSTQVVDPTDPLAGEGHLGADAALTRAFLDAVSTDDPSRILTSPAVSLHTHATVWAAERARHQGTVERVSP